MVTYKTYLLCLGPLPSAHLAQDKSMGERENVEHVTYLCLGVGESFLEKYTEAET